MLKEKFENIKNTLDIICNKFNKVDMLQMYAETIIIPYIQSENPQYFEELDYTHDENDEFLYTSYSCQCGFVEIRFSLERTDSDETYSFYAINLLNDEAIELTEETYVQATKEQIQEYNDKLFDIFD